MNVAGAIDEKLGEIPFNCLRTQEAWCLFFKKLIEGMRMRTVDLDLGKHGKAYAILVLAEQVDVRIASWILAAKLIAWKS